MVLLTYIHSYFCSSVYFGPVSLVVAGGCTGAWVGACDGIVYVWLVYGGGVGF